MTFAALWTLVLLPLWLVLFVRFARTQGKAVRWIDENVGPRFRRRLTAWTLPTARRHLAFLAFLAVLLALAATGPAWFTGEQKVKDAGRLLIAVDASASMVAEDVEVSGFEESLARIEVAKEMAAEVALRLADWDVGIASWSGTGTVHLPLQPDAALSASAARGLRIHNFYRSSGSSFESILDVALRFHDPEENALQVLLLSDGEMPKSEDFDESLDALAEAGVVVHAVGLGGDEPYGLQIWDPQDFGKPQEERRVLKEFHTVRTLRHLGRITQATSGRYFLPEFNDSGAEGTAIAHEAETLAGWLRGVEVGAGAEQREQAKRDLTAWLLGVFLLGFLFDVHLLHRGRGGTPSFDLDAIGKRAKTLPALTMVVLVALLPLSCGQGGILWKAFGGPVWGAHRSNEKGIDQSTLGRHQAAETSFLRSAAYGVEVETPTYNHARLKAETKDFAGAHELNEKALELAPLLHEARFNDGVVLYRWGVAEAHPQGCELDRTLDLWRSALRRFDEVAKSARDRDLRQRAVEQAETLRRELARLEQLVVDPPECCNDSEGQAESEGEGGGDGGGGGGGGGGGAPESDGGEPPAPPPSGQPPPSQPPPSQPPPTQPPPDQSPPDPGAGPDQRPPGGGGGLTDSELEQILGELERIRGQAQGEGKFHFRSGAEQVDEESLSDPDEIWW